MSLKQNTVAGALWQSAQFTMAPPRTQPEPHRKPPAAAPSTRAPDYIARRPREIYPKISRQMRPSSPRRLPTRRPSTALTPPPTFLDARSTRVSTRAPQKRVASRSERLVPRPQLYRNFLLPKTLGYIFLSQIDRPDGHFIQFASDFLGVGFSSRPVIGPLRLLLKYRFGTFFGTSMGKQVDDLEIASLTRLQRSLIGKPKSRDSRIARVRPSRATTPAGKTLDTWT